MDGEPLAGPGDSSQAPVGESPSLKATPESRRVRSGGRRNDLVVGQAVAFTTRW